MLKGDSRKICNKNCDEACTFVELGWKGEEERESYSANSPKTR
jgi:hypothetical protein